MEYDKIKQLMQDMGDSKLTSIDIDFPDGTKISMKKEIKEVVQYVDNKEINILDKTNVVSNDDKLDDSQNDNYKLIKSPMVGTFYLKPSPDAKPYVEIGKRIKKGDVLCIIEAMKLMNEIESEYDGEIVEILLKDGEIVEYGKPLFKIK